MGDGQRDAPPSHRHGASVRTFILPILLSILAGCAQLKSPTQVNEPAAAAFLAGGPNLLAAAPHVRGLGDDPDSRLGMGAPEPLRSVVRFDSDDGDLFDGKATILEAALFRPRGPGPYPAIVALHDCMGLYGPTGALNSHMRDWAERLVAQGYAVVMPDSFNPRGVPEMCSRDPELIRPGAERARDVSAALRWIQKQAWASPDRVALMGWANGGTTALTFATTNGRLRRDFGQPDFRLIIAFYPNCATLQHAPGWRSDIPLTILTGSLDDWSPVKPCYGLVEQMRQTGNSLDFVKYYGAGHEFDAPGMPVHVKGGITTTVSGGATIGTEPTARADAVRRVTRLLSASLHPQ